MKFQLFTAVTAALVSSACSLEDDIQSKPFTLSLVSSDKKINGNTIGACHAGAGFEALCYGEGRGDTFRLNVTNLGDKPNPNAADVYGSLNYKTTYNGLPPYQPMHLSYDYSTNVALALVSVAVDEIDYVSFNKQGYLVFNSNLDDKVNPPKNIESREINNWYACTTNYGPYTYPTIAWVFGSKPQNPSCSKVSVKRTFK